MLQHVVIFVLGLALLAGGGIYFAMAVASLARRWGAGPFVVGLLAAGLGTAAAALAFDLSAVARDRMRLAVGNIVGVNVANIGLVLGLAAMVRPVAGMSRVVSAGIPVLIVATLLFWFASRNSELASPVSAFLIVGFTVAMTYLAGMVKAEPEVVRVQFEGGAAAPVWVGVLLAILGLVALFVGGALAVTEAGEISRNYQVRTRPLGSVVVALATSLPGLVVAIVAAYRGRSDVVLATVIGACLFNVLLVPGITGLAAPLLGNQQSLGIEERVVMNEIPAMAIISLLLLTVLFNRLEVPRWQGGVLLTAYLGFVAWQIAGAW